MGKGRRERDGTEVSDEVPPAPAIGPGKRSGTARMPGGPPPKYPGKRTLTQHFVPRSMPTIQDVATKAVDKKGSGKSLDPTVRSRMEAHFGATLDDVRVHDDPHAQASTQVMGARAFTHGADIYLGPGESPTDLHLMAHELTHVVQQRGGSVEPQRKVTVGEANSPAEQQADAVAHGVVGGAKPPMLVDGGGVMQEGQMTVVDFLAQLRTHVEAAATAKFGPLWSVADCPYIEKYFKAYQGRPAVDIERAIGLYAPEAIVTGNAGAAMAAVRVRVEQGMATWAATGQLPADAAKIAPAEDREAADAQARAAGKGVQRKTLEGLESELGTGSPVDQGVAAQLAGVIGHDVSNARVHTGPVAATKAAEHGATAFAVGQNIVMGSGAPMPGSIAGDALLAHELAHVAQQGDAARDPVARKQPIGDEDEAAEHSADNTVAMAKLGNFAGSIGDTIRTGVKLQRCADPAPAAKQMDDRRYTQIETRLKALIAQKKGLVQGTSQGDMDKIDDEIDTLIAELRVDFGVRVDKGKILGAAITSSDLRVIDGRIVISPSGSDHYLGERVGFKLEVDHVPPGETLQIGWRWKTPASNEQFKFFGIDGIAGDKSKVEQFDLSTAFLALFESDRIEKAQGMEVLAHIYIGNTSNAAKTFTTNFIKMPRRPIGNIKIINAPTRIVSDSVLALDIGPQVPDDHTYAVDWFVDGQPNQRDAPHFRTKYSKLGTRSVYATISRRRPDKQVVHTTPAVTFEVVTPEEYGQKSIEEIETSPFRPKAASLADVVKSGDKSLAEIQHRIDQGGAQQPYWKDRLEAQEERLEKIKELAPSHSTARPLPTDPTKLEKGQTYSGPFTASLVMTTGDAGGGAQPLSMHITISESNGSYSVRLLDTTSKKVMKYDGSGSTPVAAYQAAFETWRTNNEYPTGGRVVVHKFSPPGWAAGQSFSTTTSWKKAKDWVDGIIQVGGFIVAALLLASPEPVITKALGAILMAAVIARSSVAIYERIRDGGDVLSSENILDAVAIVTSMFGISGGMLRSAGLAARAPLQYRVGNWLIMTAVAADGATFVYAAAEAIAALRIIEADPTMDDGQKLGEMLRIMASLFLTGALLVVTNRDLVKGGLKPHDFIKSELKPGMKPYLDAGARLDAEYELKKAGQWSKDSTPKLDDEALLNQVFTNRTRQEIESKLARQVGEKNAKALADAVGNDAFVALHKLLGDEELSRLSKEIGVTKYKQMHDAMGASGAANLVKVLGVPSVKKLSDHLSGEQLKKLVEDVGEKSLRNLTAGSGLGGDEIAALIKRHGTDVVRWVGDTLDDTNAKRLLVSVKPESIKGFQDVNARDALHLIDAFGKDVIESVVPPVKGASLNSIVELLGETVSKTLVEEKVRKGKIADLNGFASRLDTARTAELKNPLKMTAKSVSVDANTIIALEELMNGVRWADLSPHRRNSINWLRKQNKLEPLTTDPPVRDMVSIVGSQDLRIANVLIGEKSQPMPSGLTRSGLKMRVSRDSTAYKDVLAELGRDPPVGGNKGKIDRGAITDTVFADTDGSVPRWMTADQDVYTRLARYALDKANPTPKPREKVADAIVRQNPNGFVANIPDASGATHPLLVIPISRN